MSFAGHFESVPAQARRQFNLSVAILAVIVFALASMCASIAIDAAGHAMASNPADASFAGALR